MTLTVTDVRVQRLHDISEADAGAEGIERDQETGAFWGADGAGVVPGCTARFTHARHAFANLWDSINAKRGHGWHTNPWVVATTFTVHHCNIDMMP